MKRVVRSQGHGKVKNVGLHSLVTVPTADSVDAKVARTHALIPMGLKALAEALEEEVANRRLNKELARPGQHNRRIQPSRGLRGDTDPVPPGPFGTLGISLKMTNCLESLHAQLGTHTDTVDRWRISGHKPRWWPLRSWPLSRACGGSKATGLSRSLRAAFQREIASATAWQQTIA